MLQEVLFAMAGHTGGLITSSFTFSPSLPLTPSDTLALSRLLSLAQKYTSLLRTANDMQAQAIKRALSLISEREEDNREAGAEAAKLPISSAIIIVLQDYEKKLIDYEFRVLNSPVVNLTAVFVEFSNYDEIFDAMLSFVEQNRDRNLAMVLDNLFERKLNGNEKIRKLFGIFFDEVYSCFVDTLTTWLKFGKIPRNQRSEFFVKKLSSKKKSGLASIDWDNDYSLSLVNIPRNLFTVKIAKKFLFIGKCMKVIKLDESRDLEELPEICFAIEELRNFEPFTFASSVETLAAKISNIFLVKIIRKKEIESDLILLRDVYLLYLEEFYSIFIEESLPVTNLPPGKFSEFEINSKCVQNTLLRLSKPAIDRKFANVRFVIKPKGFEHRGFSEMNNLQSIGQVLHEANSLCLASGHYSGEISASLWSIVKQDVERQFEIDIAFRFTHRQSKSLEQTGKDIEHVIYVLLESSEDIRSHKKNKNLFNLRGISQFVAFGAGFRQRADSQRERESFITILAKDGPRSQIKVIFERKFSRDELDFSDQDLQFLRIGYINSVAHFFLSHDDFSGLAGSKPLAEVPLKVNEILSLDLGRCYVGLMNESSSNQFVIDLAAWRFSSSEAWKHSSTWAGLIPHVTLSFPNNIILNSSILERLSSIFSAIFPLKMGKEKLKEIFFFFRKFQGRVSPKAELACRRLLMILDHFINCLLGFFYEDLLLREWANLIGSLGEIGEIEDLRKALDSFIDFIETNLFLRAPEISAHIDLVVSCVDLLRILANDIFELETVEIIRKSLEITHQCNREIGRLLAKLGQMSDAGISDLYNVLKLRLNFNNFNDSFFGMQVE